MTFLKFQLATCTSCTELHAALYHCAPVGFVELEHNETYLNSETDGLADGEKCRMAWRCGWKFEGTFDRGRRRGRGVLTSDRQEIDGFFHNDQLVGSVFRTTKGKNKTNGFGEIFRGKDMQKLDSKFMCFRRRWSGETAGAVLL